MGKGFLDGFAVEVVAIPAPGVVRSRRLRGLDLSIEGFRIDDFRLTDRLVEDGVG